MLLNCDIGEDSWVRWTARKSNKSILKETSPGCSLEGLMLKLKLQYFGHLMWRVDSLEKTDPGRDWGQEEKGTTEDEMDGWHHRFDGHESEWTVGVCDGQGGLACCDSWGQKESDTWATQPNWTELNIIKVCYIYRCKTVILFWWASIYLFYFCIYLPRDFLRFSTLCVCVFLISSRTYSEIFLSNILISNFLFLLLSLRVCYHFCPAFKKSQG